MVVAFDGTNDVVETVNSYTYTPFGQFYGTPDETVDNPWTFTGQWYDEDIEQYYLRARMYDPAMMRFTSRDSVRGESKEPLTLHKYLYCLNEPTNKIDLSGENAIARSLLTPTIAGYAAHGTALIVATIGVAYNYDLLLDIGINIEQNIGRIMAMVAIGMAGPQAINTIAHETFEGPDYWGKPYPKGDPMNIDDIIDEHIKDSNGEGDPKGPWWWKLWFGLAQWMDNNK